MKLIIGLCALALILPCRADILLSEDAGKTWKPAGLEGKSVDEIVPDPKDPKVAYVITGKKATNNAGEEYVIGYGELHRTGDGGKTWTLLESGVQPDCLAIDPADPNRLWVGCREGAYAKSQDGGQTWGQGAIGEAAETNMGRLGNLRGFLIFPKTVIAAGGQGTGFLARSEDDGETWTRVEGAPGYVWACAVAKHALLVGGDGGLAVSFDSGKTFSKQGNPELLT